MKISKNTVASVHYPYEKEIFTVRNTRYNTIGEFQKALRSAGLMIDHITDFEKEEKI